MNQKLTIVLAAAVIFGASAAQATLFSYDFSSFTTTNIPDGNPAGWANSQSISGISNPGEFGPTSVIGDVNVRLTLSGGYNGDLYGYLLLNDGVNTVMTVLLDRVGQGTGSQPVTSFGYGDSGMNVTFSSVGVTNIHYYQQVTGWQTNILNGSAWKPDGGDLTTFNGKSGNGTWTLFLADMSGGSVSSVTSWGLDINVVPEPVTVALGGFGVLVAAAGLARWHKRRTAKQ